MPNKNSLDNLVIFLIDNLSNKLALKLLTLNFPDFSVEKADELSLSAKNAKCRVRFVKKIIAARIYQKEPNQFRFSNAAFDYDIAAKTAYTLGFIMPAIRCRFRACELYTFLDREGDREYAANDIIRMFNESSYEQLKFGIPKKVKSGEDLDEELDRRLKSCLV